jgi:carbonic anhydrase/acetyltransferase-like protein (isoleucine patch superfamily)
MDLILPFRSIRPMIAADAFVAPNAAIIGDVEIGPESSIWFSCVLRGDLAPIRVGARVNIQDGTVLHVSSLLPGGTVIGDDVSIGHMALIHACTLESGSFVGMGAIVMDGAVVESGAMVAAGALVTPGKRVPAGQLWSGRPARFARPVGDEDRQMLAGITEGYVALAKAHHGSYGA